MTWISVEDRLPELYREVIVFSEYGVMGIGMYLAHETFSHNKYPVLGQAKVTHWMPLPAPPEDSK